MDRQHLQELTEAAASLAFFGSELREAQADKERATQRLAAAENEVMALHSRLRHLQTEEDDSESCHWRIAQLEEE